MPFIYFALKAPISLGNDGLNFQESEACTKPLANISFLVGYGKTLICMALTVILALTNICIYNT